MNKKHWLNRKACTRLLLIIYSRIVGMASLNHKIPVSFSLPYSLPPSVSISGVFVIVTKHDLKKKSITIYRLRTPYTIPHTFVVFEQLFLDILTLLETYPPLVLLGKQAFSVFFLLLFSLVIRNCIKKIHVIGIIRLIAFTLISKLLT